MRHQNPARQTLVDVGPDTLLLYMSGNCVDLERCVPGSVFVAKPLQHSDILNACQRLRGK
jgi:hypothetical protein